jgi:hypothetical protein
MGRVIRTLKHNWNAFRDEPQDAGFAAGPSMPFRQPRRSSARYFNDRSMIGSIYTRMAVDLSQVEFYHAKLDPEQDTPIEIVRDSLNDRLTLDSNIDQTAEAFKRDAAFTMFEEGHVALVPIEATIDPSVSTSYEIGQLRVGRVVGWFPRRVTVEVYDDREHDDEGNPVNGGVVKQITLPKDQVGLIENPFYTIMNEPNGTLQRLLRKMALKDAMDEAAGSNKLDIIFQLPYTVRGEKRQAQAEKRRNDLSEQLKDDELGIGYIDVSEKVIQLNRPINSSLPDEIESLHKKVHDQLGLTAEIMNGSANPDQINTYYDRTIEPVANALAQEMKRKFLTKTARTQRHSIEIYRDPLKLIPIAELAEITDKVLRNAAITANELRPKIGYFPSKDPAANVLANPNMPADKQAGGVPPAQGGAPDELDGELSGLEGTIDDMLKELENG